MDRNINLVIRSFLLLCLATISLAAETAKYDYLLLATSRTSTMEKEMNEAAGNGYVFGGVMGGETGFGGKEVVVVMMKEMSAAEPAVRRYKLLAASRTGTLQKEMQAAGAEGFEYKGQTVFESTFGGKEVAAIMERDNQAPKKFSYRLLATSRTGTMQKELKAAGDEGYRLMGISVGNTSFGGSEVVCIVGKAEE